MGDWALRLIQVPIKFPIRFPSITMQLTGTLPGPWQSLGVGEN